MVRISHISLILLRLLPGFATTGGVDIVSATLIMPSGTKAFIPSNGTASLTQTSTQPAKMLSQPLINIPIISNATTCMPMMFTWQITPSTFNSTNATVRLSVTNDDVKPPPPQSPANITTVTRCVTNNTALSVGFYNWSVVTIPMGWYILDLSGTSDSLKDITAHSEKFFVMAGSNTSCVYTRMSTSLIQANSHFTSGALVGTVLGSVVGAAALLGAFLLPRLWRRGVPGHNAWKEKRGLYKVF